MRYLIFIPKPSAKLQGRALLESVGLGDHAKGFDALPIAAGPTGQAGTLFAWLDHEQTRIAHEPDQQTWIPSLISGDQPSGAYWVGVWNDSPPSEKDLRRPEGRKGAWITMADGSRWQFPSPDKLERFPEIKDGKLTWVVDEQFAWFVQEIDKRRAMLTVDSETPGKAFVSWDLVEDFGFIARALRLNYRIVPEVVINRRLISETTLKSLTTGILGYSLIED
jgi:hypothetical protein